MLFDGEKNGDWYFGIAYIFSKNCGRLSYRVEGPVAVDQKSVTMTGQAPKVNETCAVFGYKVDDLLFVYTGK